MKRKCKETLRTRCETAAESQGPLTPKMPSEIGDAIVPQEPFQKQVPTDVGQRGGHWDRVAVLILVGAFALRYCPAATHPYLAIEADESIPIVEGISWEHLPIREHQHAALSMYLIKASSILFGKTQLGYRMFDVLAGVATVFMVYRIGLEWWGRGPARWAALLLAVNEYHIAISARAIDLAFDLCFISLAMYGFARFLRTERPVWLYMAGVAAGLGFLCKEITALLVPVFFLTLLLLPHRRWLLRRQPWLALLLFVLVISPDIWCNLFVQRPESTKYASYSDHLSRFAGLGISEQPLLFYARSTLDLLGIDHDEEFDEVTGMSLPAALILLSGVAYVTLRRKKDHLATFLLVAFWAVFLFFSFTLYRRPPRSQDTLLEVGDVLWYWSDRTMLAAALMAGLAINTGFRCFDPRAATSPDHDGGLGNAAR